MSDEIMLEQTSDSQTRDDYIKAKYIETEDELASAFPGKAEKCWRLGKGYSQRPPNKDGKGGKDKQIIKYVKCPYPKADDQGNLILRKDGPHKGAPMRCGYEPKGDTQEDRQIDAIIHCKRHYKWWFDKNKKTQIIDGEPITRPPTNFPEPWQDPNFPPKWGKEGEHIIMGDDLGTKVLREELKRQSEEEEYIESQEKVAEQMEKEAIAPPEPNKSEQGDKNEPSGNEKGGSRSTRNASK